MVMNPSFNGTSISNGTRLSFDVPSPLSSPRLIHFPNPNILKQGYGGYNIGNTLSTTLPYPRCHTTMRKSRHFVPNECKDEYYWHKRLKNNEAARKSRQKRRTIDSVLEEKVLILLHENQLLRQELYAMKVKYGEIVPTPEHQQEPSSSSDNMMDCSQKMKKPNERGVGDNVALTNKLISQALAKSDEKRIGLRQSLLETINMSLSKENDGKHKMLSQHHASLADNESMLYGNNNKQMTNGMTSSQSQASAAKFPNELLSNLASGAYVLTSLSPGSEDMACLPSSINGCSAASMRSAEQHMLINCRIPSSVGMVTSQSYQQQQGDCCADEKAMEAANTLANLLKRSGSTHSTTSSIDQPLSPGSPPTPNMSTSSNSSSENHPMSHHPMHACPPQSPVQQHLIIQQQHQHHLQQQQQQQQRQLDQMMKTNENNYHQQHLLQQQQQQQQHHNGGNNSTSTTPVHSPVPSSKHEVNPKQCLPHKLRFKENKNV